MVKTFKARLKETPIIAVKLDLDFDSNWLAANTAIETAKRQMLLSIRDQLHNKIACLSLDDIEFSILEK